MTCQKCGFQNNDAVKFCIECGSPLEYDSSDFYDTDEKSGYPEQAGYPERAGYPEQTGYPERAGYPEQTGYPERAGYPEQTGYPERAGYPERDTFRSGMARGYSIVCNTYLPSGNDPKLVNMAREGWNWGAFFFTWIWLVCHNMVPFGIGLLLASFFFGPLSLIASFYLGAKGNELAWTYKPFRNLQHFEETERVWSRWGLGLFLVSMGGALIFLFLAMFSGLH